MPNTLAHFAIQGPFSRALTRDFDPRWIYLGCVLPDLPWILARVASMLPLPVDGVELRLYAMGQAALASTLLLCAAISTLTPRPRRVLGVLCANALAHLLLDATEMKWGNGVHLFAPLSWRLTRFDLVPNESPINLLLTVGGLAVLGWEWNRHRPRPPILQLSAPRVAVATGLMIAYLLAPLAFRSAVEASGSYGIRTLRDVEHRTGLTLELDRTRFRRTSERTFVILWTGEELAVTGLTPERDARVSLRGTFVRPDLLQIEALTEHTVNRDWASYVGLILLIALWARGVRSRHRNHAPARQ